MYDFLEKMPGGHIEAFYTVGGASHVPISHTGGHDPSRGGGGGAEQLSGGGEGDLLPLPPSKMYPGLHLYYVCHCM